MVWPILQFIIGYTWLFLVLFFLWRHAIGGSKKVHELQLLLHENTCKSVQAAEKSAEAAMRAVALVEEAQRKHDA